MSTLLRASIAETPVWDDHPEYTLEEVCDTILNCLKKRPLRAKIYVRRTSIPVSYPPEKLYSIQLETRGCIQDDPWRPQYV